MGSLMHESDARCSGFHVVDYEDIFFVEVFPTILCQDGKAAGHAPEDCDVAIENKLADRDVVERRIGNLRARTFESDPTDGAIAEKIGYRSQFICHAERFQVEAEGRFPAIDIIDDAIAGRGTFLRIRRYARIEQHNDRCDVFIEGSEVVKKLAHAGSE